MVMKKSDEYVKYLEARVEALALELDKKTEEVNGLLTTISLLYARND